MFLKRISERSVVVGAPAKVNLYLEVLGRREDGFHDIDSLFQAVSLFDRLRFTRTDDVGQVEIKLSNPADIPLDDSNLISRAYQLLREEFDLTGGLQVELEKNIPIAAGLGGGSADGAATILACRVLFDLPLDFAQMAGLSAQIGSDLPFFFSSGQAHVTGRGEKIVDVELPLDYWIILVTPDLAISTAEAYADLRMPLTKSTYSRSFQSWRTPDELVKWLSDIGNDFEPIQVKAFPELKTIKNDLSVSGAELARMSGSGPTVFGIYLETPVLNGDREFGRQEWAITTVRPIRCPARL
jgi:4-diphosphocytidyl-2-C-methyl-D-erythritol kinase